LLEEKTHWDHLLEEVAWMAKVGHACSFRPEPALSPSALPAPLSSGPPEQRNGCPV